MPGWHQKTLELQQQGKLQLVGIIQEQHPDRTRLFMQWKEMGWPLMIDSLNLLDVAVVPITLLIDEAGVIQYSRPTDDDLEAFLAAPERAGWVEERLDLNPSPESAEHQLVWGDAEAWEGAIESLETRVRAEGDARSHFRLGVAYRKRYDSERHRSGDFQAAVGHWGRALELDPNQYIFRRRIQQYGPRLAKPYPFYDWVPEARAAISARGETPRELRVEPRGAEFAAPAKVFEAASESGSEPDPEGRIHRDNDGLIAAEVTTVPATVPPGETARVHIVLRPTLERKAHWNNEAEGLVFWIDPPAGWKVDRRSQTLPLPSEPVSQEARHLEVELELPAKLPTITTIPAYALYYVCEDVDGTCLFRRQDIELTLRKR